MKNPKPNICQRLGFSFLSEVRVVTLSTFRATQINGVPMWAPNQVPEKYT